ncbi:folate-binding protein YgfZ [soil metagenome]
MKPSQALPIDIIVNLNHLGLIKVQGADAEKFLQSQLTCDVREVNEHNSRLGAYCNPQGRILACFRLFNQQQAFYLQMPQEIIANTLTVLKKYAVFSKVNLTDVSEELAILGYTGPNAHEVLKKLLNADVAITANAVTQNQQFILLTQPAHEQELPRYEIVSTPDAIQQVQQQLQQTPINKSYYWDYLDIVAGIPCVYTTTIGLFTPHQINYPTLGGVSFQKGCYPGQEIIARMHYLGKLKQHMYRATLATENAIPKPGTELCDADQHTIGNIVRVSMSNQENYEVLVVVQDAAKERNEVFIATTKVKLQF